MANSKSMQDKKTNDSIEVDKQRPTIPNHDLSPNNKKLELRLYTAINLLLDVLVSQLKQLQEHSPSEPNDTSSEQ